MLPYLLLLTFCFYFWYYYSPEMILMTKVENENQEVDEIVESPVEWCRRMQDEAETAEDWMNYYKLAQMWMKREKK